MPDNNLWRYPSKVAIARELGVGRWEKVSASRGRWSFTADEVQQVEKAFRDRRQKKELSIAKQNKENKAKEWAAMWVAEGWDPVDALRRARIALGLTQRDADIPFSVPDMPRRWKEAYAIEASTSRRGDE